MFVHAKEFIDGSRVDCIVPQATAISIEELFANEDEENGFLDRFSIEQRSQVYFDESISVYLVLQTPSLDEAQLKSYLARLAVSLEVQAYGFPSRPLGGKDTPKESSPSRLEDTLWAGSVDTAEDPLIIVRGEEPQVLKRHLLAVWQTTATLSRPRIRLQSPMVLFKASATLRPMKETEDDSGLDPVLPSGVPASINLLESLKGDPALEGVEPRLSASRLSGISRVAKEGDLTDRTLKTGSQKSFRLLSAVSSRVRYSKSIIRAGKASVIASLDIETSPSSSDDVKITSIDMQLSEGSIENLWKAYPPTLPLICKPKDITVFLFRLAPNDPSVDGSNASSARSVLITVSAMVLVSDTCQPIIEMQWKTGVDFSTALNPVYGAPGQSMQRQRRPSSLSRAPLPSNGSAMPPPAQEVGPMANPGAHQTRRRAVSVSNFGVSITFTAPKEVCVGQPFSWALLVLNGSRKPRNLAITVIPERKNAFSGGHLSKPSSSSASAHIKGDIADPVLDENALYTVQRKFGAEAPQLICLSTDVRVGLLKPDSCISTELRFVPLAQGHLHIDAVRVMDVVANESVDIRDLPDIVVDETANIQ